MDKIVINNRCRIWFESFGGEKMGGLVLVFEKFIYEFIVKVFFFLLFVLLIIMRINSISKLF